MQAVKWDQEVNQITVELEPNQFAVVKYQRTEMYYISPRHESLMNYKARALAR